MTLFFYCQHSVGMGHFVRSSALAERLASVFDVVFLNGGLLPPGLPFPRNVERVDLPPLAMAGDHTLMSLTASLSPADALARRRDQMLQLLTARRPAVLLVELFPFGRKKFASELIPLLEAAQGLGPTKPLVVCSLRDLLVTARRDQQAFDDRARDICDRFFDRVLVHTDACFARLEESFRPTTPLRTPVTYTGFIAREGSAASPVPRHGVLVSAGGGQVGAPLFRAAIAAHDINWPRLGVPTTIVAGPFAPPEIVAELISAAHQRHGLEVVTTVPSLAPLLARARVSVSQCGYNTALEILSSRVPALVVPYADGQENEQMRRAERLVERGVLRALSPIDLAGARLASEIRSLLEFIPSSAGLQINGCETTLATLAAQVADRVGRAGHLRVGGRS